MIDPRLTLGADPAVQLGDACVAVLGCGSVGSLAAWCLASAGIGKLELADRDRLEPANLRRHVCGREETRRPKPFALARFLRGRFRSLSIHPRRFDFLKGIDRLRDLLCRAELCLVAVDQEGPKHLIDAMCRELGRAAVHAGVYGGGWGAEVILVDPVADTPCYACAARSLGRVGIDMDPAAEPPPYAAPAPTGGRHAWAQADLCSIMPAAALAARLATAWLARRRGSNQTLRELGHPQVSAWRLALQQVPAWETGPWRLLPVGVKRQADCPVCGGGRRSPDRLSELGEEDPT